MTACVCGFDADDGARAPARLLRSFSLAYRSLISVVEADLGRDGLRIRPAPDVWGVLEYAAHTRDAVGWYDERIRLVLAGDRPRLSPFDWDAACEERRYVDEDPDDVARALGGALSTLADHLDDLDDRSWMAIGIGSDGTERRVVDLAGRAAHEGQHHLHDTGRIWRILGHRDRPRS